MIRLQVFLPGAWLWALQAVSDVGEETCEWLYVAVEPTAVRAVSLLRESPDSCHQMLLKVLPALIEGCNRSGACVQSLCILKKV